MASSKKTAPKHVMVKLSVGQMKKLTATRSLKGMMGIDTTVSSCTASISGDNWACTGFAGRGRLSATTMRAK
jgi:hypothetical protein